MSKNTSTALNMINNSFLWFAFSLILTVYNLSPKTCKIINISEKTTIPGNTISLPMWALGCHLKD